VFSELLSGKKSDKEWNPEAVLEMKELFENKGYKDIVFVSDCVFVHTESLILLANEHIQFISRLPETFNLAGELKSLVFEKNDWHDLGPLSTSDFKKAARYQTYSIRHELCGRMYDFVVVQSSTLEERKEKTLLRHIKIQKDELEKEAKDLSRRDFACEPDAKSAMDDLMAKAFALGFGVQSNAFKKETASFSHKGHPRKGEQSTIAVSYHASCVIGDIRDEFYEELKKKESTFVLIASVKDREKHKDMGILLEYKHQSSIATKFQLIKSPVYLGPVFLEKPKRVGYYLEMLVLTKNAGKILTDSGGLQKEAYFAKVPCIILDTVSAWSETVKDGWNIVVGKEAERQQLRRENIINAVRSFEPNKKQQDIFGNGKAAEKICDLLVC
jgi:transposase